MNYPAREWQMIPAISSFNIRRNLAFGITVSVLMTFAVSCNSKSESGSSNVISTATTTVAATPTPTDQVAEPGRPVLPGPDLAAQTEYRDNAKRVIDLVGQTAQLLSGTGLSLVFVEGDRSEARGIAEAARGSFDLATMLLAEKSIPNDMSEFHTALVEAIRLYSSAAQVLIDLADSDDYDVFEFQPPFHAAGAKFHEAGSLFNPIRE